VRLSICASLLLLLPVQSVPQQCTTAGTWTDDAGFVYTLSQDAQNGVTGTTGGHNQCIYSNWPVQGTGDTGSGFSLRATNPAGSSDPVCIASWFEMNGNNWQPHCLTGWGIWNNDVPWEDEFSWSRPCVVPSGETTTFFGWDDLYLLGPDGGPTVGQFRATLNGTLNFQGIFVRESDGGGGQDTCWFDGSAGDPKVTVPTGDFGPVGVTGYNQYRDYFGWTPASVTYYRQERQARGLSMPCHAQMNQRMGIYCSWGGVTVYETHIMFAEIGTTSIRNNRDGTEVTRVW
jgi:hypothetical protein